MPRTNFKFEKKQRELNKQRKKAEKAIRKAGNAPEPDAATTDAAVHPSGRPAGELGS